MTPVFRWDGQYWGFIAGNNLFNAKGEYRGWVENDGSVWSHEGRYVGEIEDQNYILRHSLKVEPVPRVPHVPPVPPVPPVPSVNRVGRVPKASYADPLQGLD